MSFVIATEDPVAAPDVLELLEAHLAFARDVTPDGHVHALNIDALRDDAVSFFTARDGSTLVGMGALKRLDESHAELKSVHTRAESRRSGIGRAMVQHLLAVAQRNGHRRVSLETGTTDAFAPGRALYASLGFTPCEPFNGYTANPYSTYLTITLEAPTP